MWRLRVWIVGAGFVAAAVVAALVIGVWNTATYGLGEESAWYGFTSTLFVTGLATLVLAMPMFLLARHAHAVNLGTILGGGVVASLIPLMLIARGADGSALLACLAAGVLGALAFWLVWRCRHAGS